MHICELVHDNLLVNEQDGQRSFRDFLRDESQMAKLFEAFIANFYRKETDWSVTTQEHISWDCPNPNDLLPEMHADAVLRGSDRVIVVECKFYREMLQANPWSTRSKFHSAHLYQVGTYLANLQAEQPSPKPEGLLIYPAVTGGLLDDLSLSGRHVRICTLNLAKPWETVASQLKAILSGQLTEPAIVGRSS
jgi:5-methylcytosine-specific restriction enzyme subunit McrC